ncbi:MAG: acyltransferase [Pyrinomonadaceae bacterium]|nr:acyltransferase [Sphingobacteriaceae bacterium]
MGNRNYIIDLLRFLAALSVALFHFNESIPYTDNWYRNLIKIGYLGVPVFFVISGYCILLTASRSKNASDFLIKRLFRIMPAYWFSLLIVLFVVIIQTLITGYNSITLLPKDIISISAVLTLLTDPFTSIPTINWVYWSLTYELFFYFVVTFSLFFSKSFTLPFLIFISLLSLIIPSESNGPLFFLYHWPTFALGLGVYLLYHKQDSKHWTFCILIFAITLISLTKTFLLSGQITYVAAALIGALLIVLSHHIKLNNNLFSKLGDYSYAIYLIHVPIGVYLIGALKTQDIQKKILLNILFDLLTYAIVFSISFLIFKYIESPFIQKGKLISKKYFFNPKNSKQALKLEIDTIPH